MRGVKYKWSLFETIYGPSHCNKLLFSYSRIVENFGDIVYTSVEASDTRVLVVRPKLSGRAGMQEQQGHQP